MMAGHLPPAMGMVVEGPLGELSALVAVQHSVQWKLPGYQLTAALLAAGKRLALLATSRWVVAAEYFVWPDW